MSQLLPSVAKNRRSLALDFTQAFFREAFADHAGLHRVAVGWIEQGKRVPSLKTLLKISQGFGISLCELLRGVDSRPKRKVRAHRRD